MLDDTGDNFGPRRAEFSELPMGLPLLLGIKKTLLSIARNKWLLDPATHSAGPLCSLSLWGGVCTSCWPLAWECAGSGEGSDRGFFVGNSFKYQAHKLTWMI